MKINHENEMVRDAIGLSEDALEKLANYCEDILNYIDEKKDIKTSHIYEKILNQLSYKDLVFLSTQYILSEHKRRGLHKIDITDFIKEIDDIIKNHKDE